MSLQIRGGWSWQNKIKKITKNKKKKNYKKGKVLFRHSKVMSFDLVGTEKNASALQRGCCVYSLAQLMAKSSFPKYPLQKPKSQLYLSVNNSTKKPKFHFKIHFHIIIKDKLPSYNYHCYY